MQQQDHRAPSDMPDAARASHERAPTVPDAGSERNPRTIFEQHEHIERPIPWEDTPSARLRDALDLLTPEVPQDLRERARDTAFAGAHTDLGALKELLGNDALARRVATLAEKTAGRKTVGGSLVDTVIGAFEVSEFLENSFAVARALRWLGETTGRTDLHVVYPASGADASGLLNYLDRTPVASVDCVTTGGPQGADVKARAKGREGRLIPKIIEAAITDGDLSAGCADAILLDTTGVAVTHGDAFRAIDHLLAPGGIIVATGAGYMSSMSIVRDTLARLPADRYRLVGRSGNAYIIERIATAVPADDGHDATIVGA
ncbi:MAG: hypothetical protein Q7T01_04090 [bacterium]|nr:hypothetical protein [bacterium]